MMRPILWCIGSAALLAGCAMPAATSVVEPPREQMPPPAPAAMLAPAEFDPPAEAAAMLREAGELARRGKLAEAYGRGAEAVARIGACDALTAGRIEPADAEVYLRMQVVLPLVSFHRTRLGEAIEYLCAAAKLTDRTDWAALRKAGIRASTPVELLLREVVFTDALSAVLAGLPFTGDPENRPTWQVREGALTIGTAGALEASTYVVAYDLVELFPPARIEPLDMAGARFPAGQKYEGFAAWLQKFCRDTMAAGSWGPGTEVRYVSGSLLIRQSHAGHAEIRRRLEVVQAMVLAPD